MSLEFIICFILTGAHNGCFILTGAHNGLTLNQVVKSREQQLTATFHALADPTRRALLERLSKGEASIGDLAKPFRMSLPAVSKHVRVLESAGLAEVRRHGRERRCRLVARPMRAAAGWMESYRVFWEGGLDRLETYLENTKE